jgi:hypothetical protein
MIQRIQSVFLFLAFLAVIALFFYPIAGIYAELAAYKFYVYGFKNMVPGEASQFTFMTTFPLLLLNILVAVLSVFCIFQYKNRVRQAKLVRLAVLLEIILIVLVLFVYANIIEKNLFTSPVYLEKDRIINGVYFPLTTLIFLILANWAILRDEKLVRSADRLR